MKKVIDIVIPEIPTHYRVAFIHEDNSITHVTRKVPITDLSFEKTANGDELIGFHSERIYRLIAAECMSKTSEMSIVMALTGITEEDEYWLILETIEQIKD